MYAAGSASAGGGSYRCPAGFKDCNPHKPGCETCVATDVNNCGDCGAKCKHVRYATAKCEGGRCKYTCDAGWTNCDGNWATGCEVDTKRDAKHCGGCHKPCQHVRNAVTKCVNGRCAQPVCDAGWANCDGKWATGCEKNVKSDVLNCGRCGHKCPCTLKGGEPTCRYTLTYRVHYSFIHDPHQYSVSGDRESIDVTWSLQELLSLAIGVCRFQNGSWLLACV